MNVKKKINVLHITTFVGGGAGIACSRLHNGLLKNNVNSRVLYLIGNHYGDTTISQYCSKRKQRIINKFISIIFKAFGFMKYYNSVKGIKGDFEVFSTPTSLYHVHNHNWIKEADIIHLHWISNFIDYPSFFKRISGKKVVWTFHDMNPFMGGFHYKGDFNRNQRLHQVDKDLSLIKVKSYRLVFKHLHLIFLNQWMKDSLSENHLMDSAEFSIIPNCIDFVHFNQIDRVFARKELGLDTNKKVILFVCENFDNKRKGYQLLLETLTELDPQNVLLLTFGQNISNEDFSDFEIKNMGFIHDISLMNMIYNSADLFVLPTLEDNLPNVMLEAWACGTPVISFDNGGMRDHIKGFNGELVRCGDDDALARTIESCLKKEYNRNDICKYTKEHFSPDIVAKRMIKEVYEKED